MIVIFIPFRYPTPVDALNDIDDCLNFVFMFSRVPSVNSVRSDVINLCCELAVEFLNYVIVTRSLRKVSFFPYILDELILFG